MAARRRRGGGKADESEGEETYETPHGEAEEEDQDSPHSSESDEYSDEGEEDEDEHEHEQDVGGEDSKQQADSQTKEPSKQETLPATTLAQDGQPDNEGELGDGDEEGDGQEAGAGEESIPPPQVEEKEKDPSYVPTIGRFFMHDDRTGSRRGGHRQNPTKLWEEDTGVWLHDKFETLQVNDTNERGRGRGRGGRGRGVRGGRGGGGRGASLASPTQDGRPSKAGLLRPPQQYQPTQQPQQYAQQPQYQSGVQQFPPEQQFQPQQQQQQFPPAQQPQFQPQFQPQQFPQQFAPVVQQQFQQPSQAVHRYSAFHNQAPPVVQQFAPPIQPQPAFNQEPALQQPLQPPYQQQSADQAQDQSQRRNGPRKGTRNQKQFAQQPSPQPTQLDGDQQTQPAQQQPGQSSTRPARGRGSRQNATQTQYQPRQPQVQSPTNGPSQPPASQEEQTSGEQAAPKPARKVRYSSMREAEQKQQQQMNNQQNAPADNFVDNQNAYTDYTQQGQYNMQPYSQIPMAVNPYNGFVPQQYQQYQTYDYSYADPSLQMGYIPAYYPPVEDPNMYNNNGNNFRPRNRYNKTNGYNPNFNNNYVTYNNTPAGSYPINAGGGGFTNDDAYNTNYNNAPYAPVTPSANSSQWVPKQSKAIPITDPNNPTKASEMTKAYVPARSKAVPITDPDSHTPVVVSARPSEPAQHVDAPKPQQDHGKSQTLRNTNQIGEITNPKNNHLSKTTKKTQKNQKTQKPLQKIIPAPKNNTKPKPTTTSKD